MGNPDNGSRHGGLKSALATLTTLGIAACSNADAADSSVDKDKEYIKLAAVTETVTRAECLAMKIKDQKIACLVQLKSQGQAEIAAKTEQRQANAETITAQQKEGQQLDTTIEVLKKEIAGDLGAKEPSR